MQRVITPTAGMTLADAKVARNGDSDLLLIGRVKSNKRLVQHRSNCWYSLYDGTTSFHDSEVEPLYLVTQQELTAALEKLQC